MQAGVLTPAVGMEWWDKLVSPSVEKHGGI